MIRLYLLGEKGFTSLKHLPDDFNSSIFDIVIGRDGNVEDDYFEQISVEASRRDIKYYQRSAEPKITSKVSIAIGWRWLIRDFNKLLVFHDSLLPRYRGFNPLVTALINGDKEIGVTVLLGNELFDSGEIIDQWKVSIDYPIKIKDAINLVAQGYSSLLNDIINKLNSGYELKSYTQQKDLVSYSVWRDENDYFINWSWDADKVRRFIDAVGFPYKGARTRLEDGTVIVIREAEVWSYSKVENPGYGKILLKEAGCPIVVTNNGLIKITDVRDQDGNTIHLPDKLRYKFI